MNEIEKMYENAGIKPAKNWQSCLNCKLKTETLYDEWGEESLTCIRLETPEGCPNAKEYYPLFTKEKQIELIKFLLKNYEGIDISKKINRFNFLVDNATFDGCHHNDKSFEESLAGVINKLWTDMPEEQKQQVKGILE